MKSVTNKLPKIALTMGDAAGIGPELVVKAVESAEFKERAEFVLYGESEILQESFKRFSCDGIWGNLTVVNTSNFFKVNKLEIGTASKECGVAAYEAVKQATLDALAEKVDAVVTAPMNKYSVNLAGINFSGHTEFIAQLCSCNEFAMMQSSKKLHVAFVTTHIPVAKIAENISEKRVMTVANLLIQALKQEGVEKPHLAIMALNPHAGENGCMGSEDEQITRVVIEKLRLAGVCVDDMAVPDVIFANGNYQKYDGIVSMYHDQGHIPFKMLAFSSGVNSTLGLPIIRTSPDHGSAFDIAWQGKADTGSFFAAVDLAIKRASSKISSNQ